MQQFIMDESSRSKFTGLPKLKQRLLTKAVFRKFDSNRCVQLNNVRQLNAARKSITNIVLSIGDRILLTTDSMYSRLYHLLRKPKIRDGWTYIKFIEPEFPDIDFALLLQDDDGVLLMPFIILHDLSCCGTFFGRPNPLLEALRRLAPDGRVHFVFLGMRNDSTDRHVKYICNTQSSKVLGMSW